MQHLETSIYGETDNELIFFMMLNSVQWYEFSVLEQ